MRIRSFARYALFLLLCSTPVLLQAQFQQPTDEELKMTSDPKAPGAAAVYLNIEENTNDPLHFRSYYARIKVFSLAGKKLATVEVPYVHGDTTIAFIKARTIHPDGTVIPLVVKPEDLLAVNTNTKESKHLQADRKVFTLPNVEVGSILEYSYHVEYNEHRFSSPQWIIQRQYFVHKAHYVFTPSKIFQLGFWNRNTSPYIEEYIEDKHQRVINSLLWVAKLPPGVTVKTDVTGVYSVDVADVPPQPDEEYMPPIHSFLYQVFFYYKAASSASDFWITDARLWSKDVDHFAEPSKAIKEAVDGLISPVDTDLDKARKLYKAVQALDNTDYSRKKTESELKQLKLKTARSAEDVWKQKSGNSEDIALLYLSMLRAAGLTAYAMNVVDRKMDVFDATFLTLSQLKDTIIVLSIGSKEIELDPGEKMCPFQAVSWRHSSAGGLSQTARGAHVVTSAAQQYSENRITRSGDVTLDGQGALTGTFHFVMTGQEALFWRQMALRFDLDEVKKQFDYSLESIFPEGVVAHVSLFTGLDNPDQDLSALVNAKGKLGAANSRRMIFPVFFFESSDAHPFVDQEKRIQPVDMHYGEIVTDQVTYHLPDGFLVERTPQDVNFSWPNHASFINQSASAPGQVTIVRSLTRAFTFAKPEEYQDLRGFYQKIAAADQQQLVLTRASAPKGNQE